VKVWKVHLEQKELMDFQDYPETLGRKVLQVFPVYPA
jgi:Fe-S cluster biosynthesis and repair protein YggX